MPIYSYRCEKCGHTDTAVRRVDNRHESPVCLRCAGGMNLYITPVRLSVANIFMDYFDPGLGEHITSPKRRKYLQEKAGFVDAQDYYSGSMPSLPDGPKGPTMEVPADLWESMEREGKGNLLTGCTKDYDLAKYGHE